MSRLAVALSFALSLAACQSSTSPQVRVLGVHQAPASHVFVQVTNPAGRPMRLQKLEYVFASSKGTTVAEGELPLQREIPAGAVAVLEVPLDAESSETLQLRGRLTAELDQIVRTFKVTGEVQPH
jgi:uncharacterized lipoprotein